MPKSAGLSRAGFYGKFHEIEKSSLKSSSNLGNNFGIFVHY
jgi:hypothetical protein